MVKGNQMSVKQQEEEMSDDSKSQCTDRDLEKETISQTSEGYDAQGETTVSQCTKDESDQNTSLHSEEMEGSETSDGTESQCMDKDSDHNATLCEGNTSKREKSEESNDDSKSQCTNEETESQCTTDTESQYTKEDTESQCTTEDVESQCTNEEIESQCATEDAQCTDDTKSQSTDEDTDQNTAKCTNEDTESQCTAEDTESESMVEDSHDSDQNTTVTSFYKNSWRMKGSEDPGEASEDMISLCDKDEGLFDTEDTAGSNQEEDKVKDKCDEKDVHRMDILSSKEDTGCNSRSSEVLEINMSVEDKETKSLREKEICEEKSEDRKCRVEPEVILLLGEDDDSTHGTTFNQHEVDTGKLQKDGVASSNTLQNSVVDVISLITPYEASKYVKTCKVEDAGKLQKAQSSAVEVISLLTDDEDSNQSAASIGKEGETEKFQEQNLVANIKLQNSAVRNKEEDIKITVCNAASSANQETSGSSVSNILVTDRKCNGSFKHQTEDKVKESSDIEAIALLESQKKLESTSTPLKGSTSSLVCTENFSSTTQNESGTNMERNETYSSKSERSAEIIDQNIKEMEPTGENNVHVSEQKDSAFKLTQTINVKPDLQNDTEPSGGDKSSARKKISEIESQISGFLSSVKNEQMKSVEVKVALKQEVGGNVTDENTTLNKARLTKTKKVLQIKKVKCSPSTPTKSKCEKTSVIQNPISTRITTWQRGDVSMSESSASRGQYRNLVRPHWCKDLREKLNTRNRMMYQNRARGKFQNYFASLRGQSWRYGTSAWGRNWQQKSGKAEWDLDDVPDENDLSLELGCEGNDLLHEFDTHGRDYVQVNYENKEDSRQKRDYSDLQPSENYTKGKEAECSQYSSNKEFGTPRDRKYRENKAEESDLTCHKKFDFDLSCSNRRQDHSQDLKDKGDVSTLEKKQQQSCWFKGQHPQ